MKLCTKHFCELTHEELFETFKERNEIFITEKDIASQELDEDDKMAKHVFSKEKNVIVPYASIIEREDHFTFGRVITRRKDREKGLGRKIVAQVIEEIKKIFK